MPRYDSAVDDLFRRMFSSTTFGREVRIGGQPNQTMFGYALRIGLFHPQGFLNSILILLVRCLPSALWQESGYA